jgi:hypothetical protein
VGQRTELLDHQLVADEREVVQDALHLEVPRAFRVVVVRVLADHDVRAFDKRLQETDLRELGHRVRVVR